MLPIGLGQESGREGEVVSWEQEVDSHRLPPLMCE